MDFIRRFKFRDAYIFALIIILSAFAIRCGLAG